MRGIMSITLQASELEQWGVARHSFESGLRCSPRHRILISKLLDVLLALGDWNALSDLLNYALEQDQSNAHALHVQRYLQQQANDVPGKRPHQYTGLHQNPLEHQPLLKRRRVQPLEHDTQYTPLQHSIKPKQLTWTSLATAIREALVTAVSSGSAAACLVSFVLPAGNAAQQTSSVSDMQTDAPTADSQQLVPAVQRDSASAPPREDSLTTKAQAAETQLVSDDAKEAGEKRQRTSKRLGSSR